MKIKDLVFDITLNFNKKLLCLMQPNLEIYKSCTHNIEMISKVMKYDVKVVLHIYL